MIVIDVPAATQAAQGIGDLVFGNAGVEYTVIPVAPERLTSPLSCRPPSAAALRPSV
jgi:hypothetical protein